MRIFVFLLLCVCASPLWAEKQKPSFQRGPGLVGRTVFLSGTVIGQQISPTQNCFIVLADRSDPAWAGLGGNGRFFLCDPKLFLDMKASWSGNVRQTGTRMATFGPYRAVLPVYAFR